MFEIPDAKRVRRNELNGSDMESDHSDNEELDNIVREKLRAKLASALEFNLDFAAPRLPAAQPVVDSLPATDTPVADGEAEAEADIDEPEEFEFRLFASSAAGPAKVVLEPDRPPAKVGAGAVLMPVRPLAYYLAARATGVRRAQFDAAAVSGDEVMAYARQRWWGYEMPWKIVARISAACDLTAPTKGSEANRARAAEAGAVGRTCKRNKLCKKMRVKKHIRDREEKRRKEEQEKVSLSKEEQLREKKKRANLAKKTRRKAKEKAKKVTGGADTDVGAGGEGNQAISANE
ncbi:hypothetical protein BROUX41_000799 [Berkeleyomyces rouxiae]|uniref:uncharacterized protein n=1 Tax=Berkeleyomyces rouxiae TaxID=2035830 RepID=UPI003B7A9D21